MNMDLCRLAATHFCIHSLLCSRLCIHTFVLKVYREGWAGEKEKETVLPWKLISLSFSMISDPSDLRTWRLYYHTDMQCCSKRKHLFGKRDTCLRWLCKCREDDCLQVILTCFWTVALLLTSCLSLITDCHINSFYCLYNSGWDTCS